MNDAGRRRALLRFAALGLSAGGSRALRAADPATTASYPDRTVRIVVGSAPGGGDLIPRLYATKLAEAFGQPFVVENRPGASFNIASEVVARAPADGHTLLFMTTQVTLTPAIMGSTVVDPVAAFAPITKVLATPMFIFVHKSLGVATLPELFALARKSPNTIGYARTGIIPYVAMEAILKRAGVEMIQVPYANAGQALTDFISGEVPVYATFFVSAMSALRDGTAHGVAIVSGRRSSLLPDVPTIVELGYPDVIGEPWSGFAAPSGTPSPILARLHREIHRIAELPEVRQRYTQLGMDVTLSPSPEIFAAEIRTQVARWPAIVKASGIDPSR